MHALRILALVLATLGTAVAAAEPDLERMSNALVDGVVIPGYERHAEAAAALAEAAAALCTGPDAESLEAAREAFHAAMDTWQAVSMFAFGPMNTLSGRARFQFWPDKRGTGARQLRAVVAGEDPSLLVPGALTGKSVALSDLQALEALLFDDEAALLAPGAYPCALVQAIAVHQAAIAADIVAAWTRPGGFRDTVRTASAGNAIYFDAAGPALDLFRSALMAIEMAADQKLGRPLGDAIGEARPRRAENWRSGRSTRNVVINLDTVIALFATPGGISEALAASGAEALAAGMVSGLTVARDRLAAVDVPLAEAVTLAPERTEIAWARDELLALLGVTRESVAAEIGLDAGFNSLDGDG